MLIDFENVQPQSLEPLAHEHFKPFIFVGASQTKLPFGEKNGAAIVRTLAKKPNDINTDRR